MGRGKSASQACKNRTRVILRRGEQGGGEEKTSCENTAALIGAEGNKKQIPLHKTLHFIIYI